MGRRAKETLAEMKARHRAELESKARAEAETRQGRLIEVGRLADKAGIADMPNAALRAAFASIAAAQPAPEAAEGATEATAFSTTTAERG